MGSGCLNAGAVLESKFKDDMTEEECKDLITEAITAGIDFDIGSGSNVDLCVIKKDGVTYLRNIRTDNKKGEAKYPFTFPKDNSPFVDV